MTKSATREAADKATFTQAEVTANDLEAKAGRKNAIINGNFDIWQRGTSQTASQYGSADRWRYSISGSTQAVSRQAFTLGQTDVPNNPKYYSRTVVSSVAGAGSLVVMNQRIEGVETFAGTTATLSFWAKADASKNIAIEFIQNFGTTGSPSTAVNGIGVTTVALTTSWVKHTVSVAIPSIATDPIKVLGTDGNDNLQVSIWLDAGSNYNARTNSLGQQSGTFEFSQVQIEAGSVATEFEPRSVGQELALCEWYYINLPNSVRFRYRSGTASLTSVRFNALGLPTTMRVVPTVVSTSSLGNASTFTAYIINKQNISFRWNETAANATITVTASFTAEAEL